MSSSVDNTCVVCFKNVDIYSVGVCDHPVCYECSTRMRVLCLQNECPICRQDLPKVIFTKAVRPFKELALRSYPNDSKYKILFDGGPTRDVFQQLLDHKCQICSEQVFKTFQHLKDHMRKEHELFFCDLCVDNLKIFTCERKVYTRQQLAHHRRVGDADDKSHKGHPLCRFCDQRYMDLDELFRHLRKDHLFCHFCDADGLHQYYNSYDVLREHFKDDHFLCEEGACYDEKFTSAFRSEIDLKAHKASIHSRGMGKQAAKQARTLEVEFTLAPRPRERPERGNRGGERTRQATLPVNQSCNHAGACNCLREEVVAAVEPVVVQQTEARPAVERCLNLNDFPSLGGNSQSVAAPAAHHSGGRGRGSGAGVTIRALGGRAPLTVTDENFPALSEPSTSQSHKVWLSVNKMQQDRPTSAPTNLSIHLNSRPRGGGSFNQTKPINRNIRMQPPAVSFRGAPPSSDSEDTHFPALKPLDSYRGTSADQWASAASATDVGSKQVQSKVQLLSAAAAAQAMTNKPVTQQAPIKAQSFVMEQDFPSLSVSKPTPSTSSKKPVSNNKKASSVTIPMSNSWSQHVREDSPVKSSDSEAPSATSNAKSKKKKKKAKSNNSSETAKTETDTKKVLSEQTLTNGNGESSKKKKKQQQQQVVSKEKQKSTTDKSEAQENNASKQTKENRAPDSPSVGNGRKRSELQIESLQINDGRNVSADPTDRLLSILRGDAHVAKPAAHINPPPGFEKPMGNVGSKLRSPPPGFTVKVNSVARPPSNQLTFTNSSGESYPILPGGSSSQFVQPSDFQRRNAALMAKVVGTLCDPGLQEEFRQMSILFRQGQLSAQSYYDHCLNLMGEQAFNDFFPEMLVLLPEINRQQDLLTVFKQTSAGKSSQHRFEVCASCHQVLAPCDLRTHVSTHALENHFPALSTSDNPTTSAWCKK